MHLCEAVCLVTLRRERRLNKLSIVNEVPKLSRGSDADGHA